jgi:hypothetical protein
VEDRPDTALLEIVADSIGVVGFVGDKGVRRPLGKIDQRIVGFSIRRFAGREIEGGRAPSGISETRSAKCRRRSPSLRSSSAKALRRAGAIVFLLFCCHRCCRQCCFSMPRKLSANCYVASRDGPIDLEVSDYPPFDPDRTLFDDLCGKRAER